MKNGVDSEQIPINLIINLCFNVKNRFRYSLI